MKIGIIGAGMIGGTLARRLTALPAHSSRHDHNSSSEKPVPELSYADIIRIIELVKDRGAKPITLSTSF